MPCATATTATSATPMGLSDFLDHHRSSMWQQLAKTIFKASGLICPTRADGIQLKDQTILKESIQSRVFSQTDRGNQCSLPSPTRPKNNRT